MTPLATVTLLLAASLVPFLVACLTSFLKIAVVLAILKNALGARDVPPAIVVTGLAVLLTLVVMAPVGAAVWTAAGPAIERGEGDPKALVAVAEAAREPVRAFLARHAHPRDRAIFADLARRLAPAGQQRDDDLAILAPAFATSQLADAFMMGFLLFLPFLVIDLFVAVTLRSLGLEALPPQAVALPMKLVLFVAVDGWALVARALVAAYA